MFALSNIVQNLNFTQMLFALTLPIIVTVFCLIFAKDSRRLHRFIKTIILVSSIAVVEVLSKNIGFFMGLVSNNFYLLVAIARALPYSLFPFVCFLIRSIDINRYRNLSQEMVVIISVLSSLLLAASIYEQASMSQDKAITLLLSILDLVLLFILNSFYLI